MHKRNETFEVTDEQIVAALETPLDLDFKLKQLIRGDTVPVGYSKVYVVRALLAALWGDMEERESEPPSPPNSAPSQLETRTVDANEKERFEAWFNAAYEEANGYVSSSDPMIWNAMQDAKSWARAAWEASCAQPVGEVDEAMVERAAEAFMRVRGLGMHQPWQSMTEQSRADYRTAFRAAFDAVRFPSESKKQKDICECPEHGRWISAEDVDRMVRQIDVALNGEEGAAKQASLCDVTAQILRDTRIAQPVGDKKMVRDRIVCALASVDEGKQVSTIGGIASDALSYYRKQADAVIETLASK